MFKILIEKLSTWNERRKSLSASRKTEQEARALNQMRKRNKDEWLKYHGIEDESQLSK